MMRGYQKEQGSALLIVMVVVSVVATLSLTIIQLALMSSRSVLLTEDGINAQIVAMAGIEDGLLRWKFNRNAEAPQQNAQQSGCTDHPNSDSDKFDRIILGSNNSEGGECIPQGENPPSASQMAYDIKMYHRLPKGIEECVGPSDKCEEGNGNIDIALQQDRTAEYSLEGLSSSPLTLSWEWAGSNAQNRVLEVVALDEGGGVCKKDVVPGNNQPSQGFIYPNECTLLRIKPFGDDLLFYKIESFNNEDSLDTRFTTIDVTGYYGGVQRRLMLKLDRLTGQALPIYDFALFASQSGISGGPTE